ncbi:MAG: NAD(P)H-dependent oxidoreductase subunit E [Planctomycetota bacterium]|nr:NAD(P)H-dependent oxidoreductase subunit E [Planctomycetota bacterium]
MTPVTEQQTFRRFERVCEILDQNARAAARLIPVLQAVQDEYGYLPEEVLHFVATSLGRPSARVFGVATFYAHFSLKPKGKYVVRMCDGTACHVRASDEIFQAMQRRLGLSDAKNTTDDMCFTLETVSCLGACGLAPVVVVNDEVHGQVTKEQAIAILDAIIEKETAHAQ